MPIVPGPVTDRRVAMARMAIIVTVTAWVAYLVTWFFEDFFHPGYENAVARAEAVLYLVIVTMLTVSALAYLLSRLGFFYRTRTHHRGSRAILDQFFDTTTPTLTTIIPYQDWTLTGVAPRTACSALSISPLGCSPSMAQLSV